MSRTHQKQRKILPPTRLAILLACTGTIIYSVGVWSGSFFALGSSSQCTPEGMPDYEDVFTSGSLFPLSSVCHRRNGDSWELIPSWINPALWVCLGGMVLCVGIAVFQRWSARQDHPAMIDR
jgi:hypothetical protein